jgi:nicotinamide mononucleotide adenylyltransferase
LLKDGWQKKEWREEKMFKLIQEAVIDIPRRTYAKGVFDDADTNNPKLKQGVLDIINNQIKQFNEIKPVLKYSLVGSILTKTYRDDADLDVNVLFDVPLPDRDVVRKELAKSLRNINGTLVPGTKHPINYYIITDPNVKETNDKMADAVFDIKNNTFIRKAKDFKFDPKRYAADFEKKVRELDVVQGELKRDIIDYNELKELNPDDVLDLQELINIKLDEIEDSIKHLVNMGNTVFKDRADAFATDMTPEEIKTFGRKNQLPKNVIFKMLEKYHYLSFYKKLKEILDDGQVTDAEIQSIQTENYNSRYTMPTGKRDAFRGDYFGKSAEKETNKRIFNIPEKKITFTFGRFNPPTIGHEKLLQKVASLGTDYKIFLSRSQDSIKNPLSPSDKLKWMTTIFRQYASHIMIMPTNMVLELATKIYQLKYTNITMVVGSDRVSEFKSILTKYNNEYNRHGFYNFEKINVVSAGERDPDEEGVTGMSASKLRDYVRRGDFKNFRRGIPGNLTDKQQKELFFDVRKGMGLTISLASDFQPEENKMKTLQEFETQQIRDLYIREVIFNIGEQAHNVNLNVKGKVVRRGTNYIVLEDTNNNLHKSWIWDCVPMSADKEVLVREYNLDVDYGFTAVSSIEEKAGHTTKLPQDKSVSKEPGTQPKKYYKDLSKSDKEKRAAHFRSQDTTKGPYKSAPGDEKAKTKPSIHTLKYKKMFGEFKKELIKMTDEKKESYDTGHDYAQHTSKMTPGEPGYDPNYQGDKYKPSKPEDNLKKITTQDIDEWASSNETIDKYRERYGDNYQTKIEEVKTKMMSFKDYAKE